MKNAAYLLLCLILTSCYTIGVEIPDAKLKNAVGWTEAQVREAYGVPHTTAEDSDGTVTLSYRLEHYRFLSMDWHELVEFTIVNGRVQRTMRAGSRRTANKNRVR